MSTELGARFDKEPRVLGLLGSTAEWRVNSTAMKINEAFEQARIAARDEALWLSAVCRQLADEAKQLRGHVEALEKKLSALEGEASYRKSSGEPQ